MMMLIIFSLLPILVFGLSNITYPLPAHCNQTGVFRIGVFASMGGPLLDYGRAGEVVANIYAHKTSQRCGVAGLGLRVEVLSCDINSNASLVPSCAFQLSQLQVHAILLAEGTLAIPSAVAVSSLRMNIPMIAGQSGNPVLFSLNGQRRFPNLFGVMTPAEMYFAPFLSLARLKNFKTVAILTIQSNILSADNEVCIGSKNHLLDNTMILVYEQVITVTDTIETEDKYQAVYKHLQEIQQLQPDILLTCLSSLCAFLYRALEELDFNPNAHATFECGNRVQIDPRLLPAASFSVSPSQFACELYGNQYQDEVGALSANLFPYSTGSDGPSSAQQFCDTFDQYSNGTKRTSLTGGQMAAFYMVDYAVATTKSVVGTDLIRSIQSIGALPTFFGLLTTDRFGRNSQRQIPQLQILTKSSYKIIWPLIEDAILPMPTFSERVFNPSIYGEISEQIMLGIIGFVTILNICLSLLLFKNRTLKSIRGQGIRFSIALLITTTAIAWLPATWGMYFDETLCAFRIFVGFLGLSSLGIISAVAFRVHRIINNTSTDRVSLPDKKLMMYALFFLMPSIVLLIVWAVMDNLVPVLVVVDPYRPGKNYVHCRNNYPVFPALLVVDIGYLLAFSGYLGFRVRKIDGKYAEYNSARLISILHILISLILTIGAIVEFAMPDSEDIRQTKFVVRFILMETLALGIDFLYFMDQIKGIWTPKDIVIEYGSQLPQQVSQLQTALFYSRVGAATQQQQQPSPSDKTKKSPSIILLNNNMNNNNINHNNNNNNSPTRSSLVKTGIV